MVLSTRIIIVSKNYNDKEIPQSQTDTRHRKEETKLGIAQVPTVQ